MPKEYRCTRNRLYRDDPDPNDLGARLGHYIRANTPEEALKKMAEKFPKEIEEGFTVHEWTDLDEIPSVDSNQQSKRT